jgi:epoxyqueuosine reductase
MQKEIIEWAHLRGMSVAIGSIQRLEDAINEILKLRDRDELDQLIFRRLMEWLEKRTDSSCQTFKSIIALALPRPAHIISFEMNDGPFVVLLPPTYVKYDDIFKIYFTDFINYFGNKLGEAQLVKAPLKTLAVKLGLAAYGKNNITYVEKFGTYHQLMAFATEKELKPYNEHNIVGNNQLQQCADCSICTTLCPTKAIGRERFLLRAERCLTFFNEREGELPANVLLPSNLQPCFIGCMVCQEFCPVNKGLLRIEPTGVLFDRKETKDILEGKNENEAWKGIRKKLDKLGILDCEMIFGRNLRFALSTVENVK